MNNITITTTNNIENAKIERYLGVVSTNIVLGTNVFSDFSASITDFFGGTSDTYQKKLDIIYKKAIDSISQKANNIGGNCIIGLNVDFDEISGKGKSMFMISATGTAVLIDKSKNIENNKVHSDNTLISVEQLSSEYQRRCLISKIKDGALPNETDWNFLANNFDKELACLLFDKYLGVSSMNELATDEGNLINNFPLYFNKCDKDTAVELAYDKIEKNSGRAIKLICLNRLFNSELILKEIEKGNLNNAIELLGADKDYYTKEDLPSIKLLIYTLDNLPNKGSIEIVKGVFSKGDEKYICSCGHKNSKNTEYCIECGLNIRGLERGGVERINAFRLKIESLEALLS